MLAMVEKQELNEYLPLKQGLRLCKSSLCVLNLHSILEQGFGRRAFGGKKIMIYKLKVVPLPQHLIYKTNL